MVPDISTFDAKILIVDDEVSNVSTLARLLKLEGYNSIKTTINPLEVRTLCQNFSPDLILLDLKMPHLNGYQVMEQIKEIDQEYNPPVFVLTGLLDHESRLQALDKGARDFLNKPFDSTEVLARIHNLLEVHLLLRYLKKESSLLEEKVRERTKELNETRLEIIRRLGMASEFRDNETGLHIIRMSKVSALLARALGKDEGQCELLLNATPMHDVGKIGIPDNILLKPSKLDPNEWEIMKSHTTIGFKLLSGHNSDLMEMAAMIALTHHEKWDGTGYPKGLKGEKIPLEGRIAALCDVFDALISKRPYKKAWSVEDSVSEINRNSGKHFEPALVELFNKILPDILSLIKKHSDPL